MIVAQVGIAGSVEFEDGVVVGAGRVAGILKLERSKSAANRNYKNVEAGAFLRGIQQFQFNWLIEYLFFKENYRIFSKGLPKTKTKVILYDDRVGTIFSGTSNLPLAQEICST